MHERMNRRAFLADGYELIKTSAGILVASALLGPAEEVLAANKMPVRIFVKDGDGPIFDKTIKLRRGTNAEKVVKWAKNRLRRRERHYEVESRNDWRTREFSYSAFDGGLLRRLGRWYTWSNDKLDQANQLAAENQSWMIHLAPSMVKVNGIFRKTRPQEVFNTRSLLMGPDASLTELQLEPAILDDGTRVPLFIGLTYGDPDGPSYVEVPTGPRMWYFARGLMGRNSA